MHIGVGIYVGIRAYESQTVSLLFLTLSFFVALLRVHVGLRAASSFLSLSLSLNLSCQQFLAVTDFLVPFRKKTAGQHFTTLVITQH